MKKLESTGHATYVGRTQDGVFTDLEFGVSAPVESGHGDWYCRVLIRGVMRFNNRVYGANASQAFRLSMQFVRCAFEEFIESGGAILHPGSEEEVNLDEVFP